jgi:hypothetical protein
LSYRLWSEEVPAFFADVFERHPEIVFLDRDPHTAAETIAHELHTATSSA